jgi:RNA polymerase sigma factor (sigma-70 family)
VDYDELVNELYVHLMENDAKRLRSFRGRSSVYQWLKCVAIRFFIAKRKQAIEEKTRGSLYEKDEPSYDPHEIEEIRNDILALLDRLQNDRYRYVLKQHFILGVDYEEIAAALRTSPANVYNIKKRAITKLTVIVLDDIGYEKH